MSATASVNLGATLGRGDEEKSRATGSATGETSRAHTLSNVGSEADFLMNSTLLLGNANIRFPEQTNFEDVSSIAAMRALVEKLEQLLAHPTLRSPQQPNSTQRYLQQRTVGGKLDTNLKPHSATQEIDTLISQACAGRPENRTHLASLTRSPWLRQRILSYQPRGGRAAGSATLGMSHSWRREKLPMSFTDHNWPKVAIHPHGTTHPGSFLPGGDHRHNRLLRCPADALPVNHTLELAPAYTVSKDSQQGRFWGSKENGEIDKRFVQLRGTPGPGTYFKSMPRGPTFTADAGETVVLGANHTCPWKSPLGHYINPVDVDVQSIHPSSAKFSFSKTRRSCSESFLGHGTKEGGPMKTDQGCLSPGFIYEHCSSFRPGVPLKGKRRSRSTSHPRMRCEPVPPEPEPVTQNIPVEVPDEADLFIANGF